MLTLIKFCFRFTRLMVNRIFTGMPKLLASMSMSVALLLSMSATEWMRITTVSAQNANAYNGRMFPDGVKRGRLSTNQVGEFFIDNKLRYLAVGVRIYDEDNHLITSSNVDARNLVVNYVINEFGEIEKIWILTLEETKYPLEKTIQP